MHRTLLNVCLSSVVALSLCACSADEEGAEQDAASSDAGGSTGAPEAGSTNGNDGGNSSGNDSGVAMTSVDAGSKLDAATADDASQSAQDAGGARDTGMSAAETGSGDGGELPKFSFFVTSLHAMRTLSKSENGFGGNLSYGETGAGAGLRGADKICADAAELGMAGAGKKEWRAFLSTTTVHAKSRIGQGPWYDRNGRLVAMNLTALLKERPEGAEMSIRDDLPNENGQNNRAGSAEGGLDDNHDVVTATNAQGEYDGTGSCEDWTSTNTPSGGMGQNGPRVGHSWPAQSGRNWMAAHRAPGCSPSVSLRQTGGGSGTGIGNGGGYGGIYCFALTP